MRKRQRRTGSWPARTRWVPSSRLPGGAPPLPGDDAAWDVQHAWGAERARRMVRDLGGYTKVGQIAAAGAQMMPRRGAPPWRDHGRGAAFILEL